jgi:hypothetical protein
LSKIMEKRIRFRTYLDPQLYHQLQEWMIRNNIASPSRAIAKLVREHTTPHRVRKYEDNTRAQ